MAGRFNLAEHIQAAQPPAARDIEVITREILDAKHLAGESILTIGQGLIEAKSLLSHGEWLPWLEERVEFSERTARNFMRLAREWTNRQALADLGAAKALTMLALPPEERETFMSENHIVNGEEKTVIDMTSRELEAAIKERDDALKAAEQARDKISADMTLANKRIAGLSAEVEAQSAKAREAQDTAVRLEKELAELRSRPVEVAVEVDAAAVEAARRETEAAMQKKLDKAKKAQRKAEADKKAAEDAKTKAEQALAQATAEALANRKQAEQAEKKAAISSNEDLVLFRTLFDQAQDLINKLGGVLMKTRNKDPETAGPLQKALLALADRIKEVAEG